MSFWRELKRRNVFRVGAVYLAVAWLIAQIVAVVDEPLGLPGWFDTAVILLLAAGFPVALVLAWALELTPEGLRLESGTADARPPRLTTGRTIDFAVIAALVVALGLTLFNREARAPSNSIAVLRFVNLNEEAGQNYLSDGIAVEIQNRLARMDGLVVAGQNSAFQFDAGAGDYAAIGRVLNVAYVLEGSVLRSGDRIRVVPQVVRVADGFTIWSDAYNREGDDNLSVLEDIPLAVVDALSMKLGVSEPQFRYIGTDSFEAWDWFSKGREIWSSDPSRAIEAFRRATEIDEAYALPWAWMSNSYGLLAQRTAAEEFERNLANMARAARRGVELGPGLWEAHNSLAWSLLAENDWIGADEEFRRSVDLARSTGARMDFQYATFGEAFGRMDATIDYLEALRETDPLNRENSGFLRNALAVRGRYPDMLEERERIGATDIDPSFNFAFPWLIERGEVDKLKAALGLVRESVVASRLAAVMTSRDATLTLIRDWLEVPGSKSRQDAILLALYAAYYDDTALANRLLRQAFLNEGWGGYFLIWHDVLSETRRTPGFKAFLTELGFVDLFRSTGEWNDYCRPVGASDFECI